MKIVKVQNNQTLVDIAVQELGDASRAMEVAVMNDMNLTQHLVSGSTLMVPDAELSKRSFVNLFKDKANSPASFVTEPPALLPEGIGFWYIENDFIVQ